MSQKILRWLKDKKQEYMEHKPKSGGDVYLYVTAKIDMLYEVIKKVEELNHDERIPTQNDNNY